MVEESVAISEPTKTVNGAGFATTSRSNEYEADQRMAYDEKLKDKPIDGRVTTYFYYP